VGGIAGARPLPGQAGDHKRPFERDHAAGGRPACFNHVDALSILEQIEGATAYVRSLGVKAEEKTYKKLMMTLTAAHRSLHNIMHQNGLFHEHTPLDDHHGNRIRERR
jgi:hypothetical protein